MKDLAIKNWKKSLEKTETDKEVGIKIADLTGNETFSMYVTEIPPKAKINAHYHENGIEIYQILSGSGTMHTASPDKNGKAINIRRSPVSEGDFFTVEEKTIHQLENTGDIPLVLIFGCPRSHLGEDRKITSDLITEAYSE
jgi:mannose-6-phosphate isomerase-like protein (cupin superfamily)